MSSLMLQGRLVLPYSHAHPSRLPSYLVLVTWNPDIGTLGPERRSLEKDGKGVERINLRIEVLENVHTCLQYSFRKKDVYSSKALGL